jgi:hypothetical protein
VTRLSLEKLSAKVALVCVGFATLAWLSPLQCRVRGEQSLMVGRAALGFFAACGIERRSVGGRHSVAGLFICRRWGDWWFRKSLVSLMLVVARVDVKGSRLRERKVALSSRLHVSPSPPHFHSPQSLDYADSKHLLRLS